MLQNCHLLPKWLKTLEKILDKLEKPHKVHLRTLYLCVYIYTCMYLSVHVCVCCVCCSMAVAVSVCASISVIQLHAVVGTESHVENTGNVHTGLILTK